MIQFHRGISRRSALAAGIGAFSFPRSQLLGASGRPGGAKSVIFLLQEGGLSHFESWDPKPDAPSEIRGSFGTIHTTNPDLRVSEYMPRLAQQAQLYSVVRSAYMDNERRDHSPGLHWVLTGFDNQSAGVSLETVNRAPSVGAVVAHHHRQTAANGLPPFVAIPSAHQLGTRVRYTGARHLGNGCEPFDSGTIPKRSDRSYSVPVGLTLPSDISVRRLSERRGLLQRIDQFQREESGNLDEFQSSVFDLLLGRRGQEAFDLNRESAAIRRAYGESRMGQGTLLARRLVEAGVPYVLVNYSENNSWDTHVNNFKTLRDKLLPPMDQAVSALLADLDERGILDDVLVVLMGEMGRTPKINAQSGRDHWPDVFSLMVAGGGMTRGQVLGRSTQMGDLPAARPMHYHELLATIYHQLGIAHDTVVEDRQGRPVPIMPEAHIVPELIV